MEAPGPEETLDRLCGEWRVLQLRRGHRFSTDDVLTAWTARHAAPRATALLDLGAGVGSVGLLTLRGLPAEARADLLEVQAISARLARRTVALNRLERRVRVMEADLRHDPIPTDHRYSLITANPPYLPPHRATASPHRQRAAARLELHGDVFDYCRAAARHLAPEGRFCLCFAARDPRPPEAVQAAGMAILARRPVIFRADHPPMLTLYTCGWRGACEECEPLVVRDRRRAWTPAYLAIRSEMELAP